MKETQDNQEKGQTMTTDQMAQMCYGCANVGDETVARHAVETWDAGNGWVTYWYCEDCYAGLDEICDRCEAQTQPPEGYGLCQECIDDFNAGERFGIG